LHDKPSVLKLAELDQQVAVETRLIHKRAPTISSSSNGSAVSLNKGKP
jgi:hypothetical protein